MPTKHAFVSAKSDGGDATLVRPSNWNADHTGARSVVNAVTDHGLSSGGTAAANQTALQAAVTAAENAGATLYIPAASAEYSLAGTINISRPIVIYGDAWGQPPASGTQLKMANASNAYVFTITPTALDFVDGVVIRDLFLSCNGANQTTGGGGIQANGTVYSRFEHLQIRQPWGNGIELGDDASVIGHNNVIYGCFFENGDQSNGGDGRGVLIDGSDENTVEACTFQGMGRTAAGEPNAIFDRAGLNAFIGNHFITGETGIKIEGSRSRIIGNTFDGCRNHHVRFNGGQNVCSGNTFYNIGYDEPVVANTIDGIWVDNVAEVTITGNVFLSHVEGGARSGVNLSSGPATSTVVANNVFSIVGGTAWGTGAVIPGTGAGHIIRHNIGYAYADDAYARGTFNVPDGKFDIHAKSLVLTSTQRATIAGTGRLVVI